MQTTRRTFSAAVFGGVGLTALGVRPCAAQPTTGPAAGNGAWPGFPHQSPALVRATVGAAHRDLEQVKSLVTAHPALANAAWDWGFGDWETALGAASHTGRREIAEYLIAAGARPDLFAAAMLGQTETVRAFIGASPGVQTIRGPHGIPLLAHAESGGERASETAAYLRELGDAGPAPVEPPLAAADRDRYLGEYAYSSGAADRFTIRLQRERVGFQTGEEPFSFLRHAGDHRFHPPGVPGVQIVFGLEGERCASTTIIDHDLRVVGLRV